MAEHHLYLTNKNQNHRWDLLRNLKLTKDYKHGLSILCQKNSHHNNLLDLVKYCDKYFDLYYAFYLLCFLFNTQAAFSRYSLK